MMRILAAGVLLAGACGTAGARPVPAAPPPVVPPPAVPPARVDDGWRTIDVCVVDAEGLRYIQARYDHATGDTTVGGRPFAEAYPVTAAYAAAAQWYVDNEPIALDGVLYTKYGLPRTPEPHEIVRAADHRGVLMFREVGDDDPPRAVYYAAVRPTCELHPYQWDLVGPGIRG
jgi:hypothetical protein